MTGPGVMRRKSVAVRNEATIYQSTAISPSAFGCQDDISSPREGSCEFDHRPHDDHCGGRWVSRLCAAAFRASMRRNRSSVLCLVPVCSMHPPGSIEDGLSLTKGRLRIAYVSSEFEKPSANNRSAWMPLLR